MVRRIPLVRVEGKTYALRPDLTMTPARFAVAASLEREARDQEARDAESEFGFAPSLYFYAGVAHPAFGDVVLVFDPEASVTLPGTASTFDTGGMHLGLIKGKGLDTPEGRRSFVVDDCCDLVDWRQRADAWIGQFASLDSYLRGDRACIDDKTGRLQHSANERRAWCFEVRVYGDRGVFEDLAFAVVRQEFWQLALDESSATPEAKAHLLSLQRSGKVHTCDAVGPTLACPRPPSWRATLRVAGGVRDELDSGRL